MSERLSVRRKAGKPRANTNARTEPVVDAAEAVRRQVQPDRARGPREGIHTRRNPNPPKALPLLTVLSEIRLRLLVAMAASAVCSAALKAQHADFDEDVATLLQRSIADELNRQIERLDAVIARYTP